MYGKYSIDELIELEQEHSEDTEVTDIRAEIARRFREGINVECNASEAMYWESLSRVAENDSEKEKSTIIVQDEFSTEESSGQMSDVELLSAYRKKDPWATYRFSLKLIDGYEYENAMNCLMELENHVRTSSDGMLSQSMQKLLILINLKKALIYEITQDFHNAIACYEYAILELGCAQECDKLLALYRYVGTLDEYESKVLTVIGRLADADDRSKYLAADTYFELNRKTEAAILYKEIVDSPNLDNTTHASIIIRLLRIGAVGLNEMESKATAGCGVTSYAVAKYYLENEAFDKALRFYQLSAEQSSFFSKASISGIEQIRKILKQREDEAVAAELAHQIQLKQEKRDHRRTVIGKPKVYWSIVILLSIFLTSIVAICYNNSQIAINFAGGREGELIFSELGQFLNEAAVLLILIGGIGGPIAYNVFTFGADSNIGIYGKIALSLLFCPVGIIAAFAIPYLFAAIIYLIGALIGIVLVGIVIICFVIGVIGSDRR